MDDRELIHQLGQALKTLQRRTKFKDKDHKAIVDIAMHEYEHYCTGNGDHGYDVMRSTLKMLGGNQTSWNEAADLVINRLIREG